MAARGGSGWLAVLRTFDEPSELGKAVALEFSRDIDRAATPLRFQPRAARLSDVFGRPLAAGEGPS